MLSCLVCILFITIACPLPPLDCARYYCMRNRTFRRVLSIAHVVALIRPRRGLRVLALEHTHTHTHRNIIIVRVAAVARSDFIVARVARTACEPVAVVRSSSTRPQTSKANRIVGCYLLSYDTYIRRARRDCLFFPRVLSVFLNLSDDDEEIGSIMLCYTRDGCILLCVVQYLHTYSWGVPWRFTQRDLTLRNA